MHQTIAIATCFLITFIQPDTLKCIAMFAGAAARNDVVRHLNNIGNAMNMELNAHTSYDELRWRIEAKEEGGKVRFL